ncbi:hypothetical protein TWF696_009901 [Orbilia brochopaga]|uniref:Pentatricopeptide repeat-containing protein n=1 Tax=Orbilia brochopaga TaxID=3140254 RepID=A0AAV9UBX7_9PEZI
MSAALSRTRLGTLPVSRCRLSRFADLHSASFKTLVPHPIPPDNLELNRRYNAAQEAPESVKPMALHPYRTNFSPKPTVKQPRPWRPNHLAPRMSLDPPCNLRERIRHRIEKHQKHLCISLLSSGHSPVAIAGEWRRVSDVARLSLVGSYLTSRRHDRVLLRTLQGYILSTGSSRRPPRINLKVSWMILIGCIDSMHKIYRLNRLSKRALQSRASRICDILISMSRLKLGFGIDPVVLGVNRVKFLLTLLTPESILELYQTLMLSKSNIPRTLLLSILDTLTKAGLFVQAIQIFQKISLLSPSSQRSWLIQTWQLRRLFQQLYQTGIPIHQSDMLTFLSSIGPIDPLIYKTFLYAAARDGDILQVRRLGREYEAKTGMDLPLDVISATFNLYRRLGDTIGLRSVYEEAEARSLQPLTNVFFVTAVLQAEAQKPNSDYWQLCGIFRRFFNPSLLTLLHLPITGNDGMVQSAEKMLEPSISTLAIMLFSYLRTVGAAEGSMHAFNVYTRYLELLQENADQPQFQTASEHFLAVVVGGVGRYKSNLGVALGIVQDMIELPHLPAPTGVTWDSLLRASIVHRDVDISERIWEAMLEHGVSPTLSTYNSMIVLYTSTGAGDKARILRTRMEQAGWSMAMPLQRGTLEIFQDEIQASKQKGTSKL